MPSTRHSRLAAAAASVRDALSRRVGVDVRALAALRVALGGVLLLDLVLRSRHLVAFYTDAGVLPRALLREQFPLLSHLSVHTLSGTAWVQAALFGIAGVTAVALLLGYRTRTATLLSWLLLVSLHARNPFLLTGGDSLLRRLLFWSLFLPLGARYSVDAGRAATAGAAGADAPDQVRSVASAGLLCQVVFVYTVNGLYKLRHPEWLRGTATRHVLELDQFTHPTADLLARFGTVVGVLDRLWLALVLASALLVVLTGRSRTALVAAFATMHAGMLLTMRLGVFPLISLAALLPFLPGGVWDAVTARAARHRGSKLDFVAGLTRSLGCSRRRIGRRLPDGGAPLSRLARAPSVTTRARASDSAVVDRARRGVPFVLVGLLVGLAVWNAAALGYVAAPDGERVTSPGAYSWTMFSSPPKADVWYVARGRTEAGEQVVFPRVAEEPPPPDGWNYPSARWRMYLLATQHASTPALRHRFAAFLCTRWSREHATALTAVTVTTVEQPVRFDGPDPVRRPASVTHTC